ncbi:MAG: ATP-binding protein [Armatimonadota bacterium]
MSSTEVVTGEMQKLKDTIEQLSQQLHESETRFYNIITTVDALLVLDKSCTIWYANPAAEILLGRGTEDLAGEKFDFPLIEGESTEIEIPKAGLASRTVDMSVAQAKWEGANAYIVLMRDITDRKRAIRAEVELKAKKEQERIKARAAEEIAQKNIELESVNKDLAAAMENLRASQDQLVQSEKLAALGRVVAGVAHELNNPIMGSMNYVEYCLERMEEDSPFAKRLSKAKRELERCARIVTSMLTYCHNSSDYQPVWNEESLNLKEMVADVVDLLARDRPGLTEEVHIVIPEDATINSIKSDELRQILINLITNAHDAVSNREVRRVVVHAVPAPEGINLTVADTGCGMEEDVLNRMFDPFFTTKTVGRGSGLGMAVSQNLIKKMGGSIDVKSKVDEGTTISIFLPSGNA